jgi:hypothetical protein
MHKAHPRRWLALTIAMLGFATAAPISAKPAAPAPVLLTRAFADFYDATVTLPETERIKRFRESFAKLLPGFYAPRNRTEAAYDRAIARSLRDFPQIRLRYAAVADYFPKAFADGQQSFRRVFPDYRLNAPIYLLHSLGEMDGGTREIDGETVGIFGADVIARIHSHATIKPFLDHELFHLYHQQFFPNCEQLWCSLWEEGLAVYVAAKLNPGATDDQLLLTQPQPIRPAVEPRLPAAMCTLRAKLESKDESDFAPFFFGSSENGATFPSRYGYFLGYLLVQKIGAHHTPEQLAKLAPASVHAELIAALAAYGPCS